MSSTMKDDSHKLYKKAKETRISLMLRKYALFFAIAAIIMLFVMFKIYL